VIIFEDLNNDHVETHVEQNELRSNREIELLTLIKDQHSQLEICTKLKEKNALLTRDNECLIRQINFFKTQEKREESFEVAFAKSHQNEKSLERHIRDLASSKNALLSQIEQLKHEHKKQLNTLTLETQKAKAELLTCQKHFSGHKQHSTKQIDNYLKEIVDLQTKIKEFRNVVYKHGESITTIQKFTFKPNPNGYGPILADYKPKFSNRAFKPNPDVYSAEHRIDDSIMTVVEYNCMEELDADDESRSKMKNVVYNKPFNYSKVVTFVKQQDTSNKPFVITPVSEVSPKQIGAQINGPLPSLSEFKTKSESFRVIKYFDTFLSDLKILEREIEFNSEIRVEHFQSPMAREHRDILQKRLLPHVKILKTCALYWERDFHKELGLMKTVFDKTETSISNTKRKKKLLRKDVDRILENVICADINNLVVLQSVAYASAHISADSVDIVVNIDKVHQIESLKAENERLLNELSNSKRRLQWCQKDFENRLIHKFSP